MSHRKIELPAIAPAAQSIFICPVPGVIVCVLAVAFLAGCGRPAPPAPPPLSAAQIADFTAKAEKGDAQAQRNLGAAYAKGDGVKQDYHQAAEWYQKAAQQGDAQAQLAMGELCEAGQGVKRDAAQAATWYRRAAEQGLAGAQYDLAALYAVGTGVPLNNAEALKWYLQAANQGDPLAQYNVGMRYLEGHGVRADPVIAFKWLSLASAQHLPDAAGALATAKSRLSSEQLAKGRELVQGFQMGRRADP